MMINKRLIHTVKESKTYIAGNVICQWISLAANITMMGAIAGMLRNLFEGSAHGTQIAVTAAVAAAAVAHPVCMCRYVQPAGVSERQGCKKDTLGNAGRENL